VRNERAANGDMSLPRRDMSAAKNDIATRRVRRRHRAISDTLMARWCSAAAGAQIRAASGNDTPVMLPLDNPPAGHADIGWPDGAASIRQRHATADARHTLMPMMPLMLSPRFSATPRQASRRPMSHFDAAG
jgi:hypothetical protein